MNRIIFAANRRKNGWLLLNTILFLLTLTLPLIGGCATTAPQTVAAPTPVQLRLLEENKRLISEKQRLERELDQQNELTARLQLSLLEKHAAYNKLLIKNERLVNEFVRNKPNLRKRNNRVETVRLLAEVAALVDTARSRVESDWKVTVTQAEQCLRESQVELENDNLEGASYLAGQALDLIQSKQLETSESGAKEEQAVTFVSVLPMRVLDNSNVRKEPSLKAPVLFVQRSGSKVTAVGYSGLWVKIRLTGGKHGWIHYSLLSGAL